MIALYFIVALFTANSSNDKRDVYIFDTPSFYVRSECVKYVKSNFGRLNMHVNKEYDAREDNPNLFFCMNKKEVNDMKYGRAI